MTAVNRGLLDRDATLHSATSEATSSVSSDQVAPLGRYQSLLHRLVAERNSVISEANSADAVEHMNVVPENIHEHDLEHDRLGSTPTVTRLSHFLRTGEKE